MPDKQTSVNFFAEPSWLESELMSLPRSEQFHEESQNGSSAGGENERVMENQEDQGKVKIEDEEVMFESEVDSLNCLKAKGFLFEDFLSQNNEGYEFGEGVKKQESQSLGILADVKVQFGSLLESHQGSDLQNQDHENDEKAPKKKFEDLPSDDKLMTTSISRKSQVSIEKDSFKQLPETEGSKIPFGRKARRSNRNIVCVKKNASKLDGSSDSPELPISLESIKKRLQTRQAAQLRKVGGRFSPYKILKFEEKQFIVKLAEEISICKISESLGISVNNICRWRKNCSRKSGAGRRITDTNLEQQIREFVNQTKAQGVKLSRGMIQKKAKELSAHSEFKASKGWLERFCKRNSDIFDSEDCLFRDDRQAGGSSS